MITSQRHPRKSDQISNVLNLKGLFRRPPRDDISVIESIVYYYILLESGCVGKGYFMGEILPEASRATGERYFQQIEDRPLDLQSTGLLGKIAKKWRICRLLRRPENWLKSLSNCN